MKVFDAYPTKQFQSDEVLLYAGDTPKNLFFLNSGHVKQFTNSKDGKELIIHIYENGAIFPLSWGLNKIVPEHHFISMDTVEVTLVPTRNFSKILLDHPDIHLEMTKRLVSGISGLSKRIEILNFENAQGRIISTLTYLKKHFGSKLSFTHEELAALTGLSRERVSIEMKKLKDKKLISYTRSIISLKSGLSR